MVAIARRLVLLVLVLVLVLVLAPLPQAVALEPEGALGQQLFANHCAGCHIQGGNIIRRNKTLKLAALQRQGIDGPAAIAAIAAAGVGQMGGYAAVLGDGGPEAVAAWVWQQAEQGWPRG